MFKKLFYLLLLLPLIFLLFLFHSCTGQCGSEKSNSAGSGEDGSVTFGEEGSVQIKNPAYFSGTVTASGINNSKITTGINTSINEIILEPSEPIETEARKELYNDVAIYQIILRSDIISRSDVTATAKQYKHATSNLSGSVAELDENGEFTLEVPTDEEFFMVVVAESDTSSLLKNSNSSGSVTPLGLIKFEKSGSWESNINLSSSSEQVIGETLNVGTIDFNRTGGFFKAEEVESTEISFAISGYEEGDGIILINDSSNYNLTIMKGKSESYTIKSDGLDNAKYTTQSLPEFCEFTDNSDDTANLTCEPTSSAVETYNFVIYASKSSAFFKGGDVIKADVILKVKSTADVYSWKDGKILYDLDAVSTDYGVFVSVGKDSGKERIVRKFEDGKAMNVATLGVDEGSKNIFLDKYLVIAYQEQAEAGQVNCDIVDLEKGQKIINNYTILTSAVPNVFGDYAIIKSNDADTFILVYYTVGANNFFLFTYKNTIVTDSIITSSSGTLGTKAGTSYGIPIGGGCIPLPNNSGEKCHILFGDTSRIDGVEFTFDKDNKVDSVSDLISINTTYSMFNKTVSFYIDSDQFLTMFYKPDTMDFYINSVINGIPQGAIESNVFDINIDSNAFVGGIDLDMSYQSTQNTLNFFLYNLTLDTSTNHYGNVYYSIVDPDSYEVLYTTNLATSTFTWESPTPIFGSDTSGRKMKSVKTGENANDFMLFYPDYDDEEEEFVIRAIW